MESMDNQEFDRKIKAKVEKIEFPVPAGVWDRIAEELDAVEKLSSTPIKETKPVVQSRTKGVFRLKQSLLRYGAIAAMLFIAFVLLKNLDNEPIYLQNNQQITVNEPVHQAIIDSVPNPVFPTAEVEATMEKESPVIPRNKIKPEFAIEKSVYASLNDIMPTQHIIQVEKNIMELGIQEKVFVPEVTLTLTEQSFDGSGVHQEMMEEQSSLAQEPVFNDMEVPNPGLKKGKKIGVSTVLNLLARGFNQEEGNSIEFSETEEGILIWDIKSSLARKVN